MTHWRRWSFAALVALQLIFLLGWAGWHEWVRSTAPTVMLKTRPVDPRDIVRGQFFILRYDISDVEPAPETDFHPGETVWVGLDVEDGFASAAAGYETREGAELSAHDFVARGSVSHGFAPEGTFRVMYGIEDYYVPEGTLEPDRSKLVVEASVSPDRRLQIRNVFLDGAPFP